MKKDSYYIVNLDDKSSTPQFSVYRVGFNLYIRIISSLTFFFEKKYWRRLHRQQRGLIIAFIFLFIFIYIGFHFHSNKLAKQISSENHREKIDQDKNLWQQKQSQVS
jgi:amino acid permease